MSSQPSPEQAEFRAAMARLGAAVNIVTTDGPAGRHGMVASAVCSVSDAPPTILVCVNRGAMANAVIRKNEAICVNVLGSGQDQLSANFADSRTPIAERFVSAGEWEQLSTGAPALCDALASVDCRIVQAIEVASHTVFIAEVAEVRLGEARGGLVYFDRAYHQTTPSQPGLQS